MRRARPWQAAPAMAVLRREELVAIERDAIFADRLLLALMAESCGDRRNSDFTVAIGEPMRLALGVLFLGNLSLLRCLGLLHFHVSAPIRLLGFPLTRVWTPTWAELRKQSCSIVAMQSPRDSIAGNFTHTGRYGKLSLKMLRALSYLPR